MSRIRIAHGAGLAVLAGLCTIALIALMWVPEGAGAQAAQAQAVSSAPGDAKPVRRRRLPAWIKGRLRKQGQSSETSTSGNAETRPSRRCPDGWTGRPPICCPPGERYFRGRCQGKDRPRVCPRGKVLTRGHCCWPWQRWTGRQCSGGGGGDGLNNNGGGERPPCPPGTKGKPPFCASIGTLTPSVRQPATIESSAPHVPSRAAPPGVERLAPPQPLVTAQVPRFRPGELLILLRGADPDGVAAGLARSFNLTVREGVTLRALQGARVYRLGIPDNRSVEGLAAAMARIPGVSIASPNFYSVLQGRARATPAEPPGQAQDAPPGVPPPPSPAPPSGAPEALGVPSSGGMPPAVQYALDKLRIPAARRLALGRGVTIAVIDSAVDTAHPVLRGADIEVFDALSGSVPRPDQHGTAITGIIAARGQLTGVAPEAKVIAVRAFAPEIADVPPLATSMALAAAVDLGIEKKARVFNMSFAGPRDPLLIAMIDAASAEGAIFVAAAGNNGPGAPSAFPAAHDKVIAVTATDANDRIFPHANHGAYIGVAAPGVDIVAPVTGDGMDYLSGTSFAAAYVSGIVALLMEYSPGLRAEDARRLLAEGARDLGEKGPDESFGAGLADAYEALSRARR